MDPGSSPGGGGTTAATGPPLSYPSGQQFCVSWNSYQSNMHSAFPKLLSTEQFVDVTLACDGGSIKCHKVVISACSDYLERLLLDLPCTHPIIFLRDMKMWELQALVEFMYRGEVYVEQSQLQKLMQAAEALQIRGLSNGKNQLDSSNHMAADGASTPMNNSVMNNSSTPIKPSTPKFQQSNVPSCGASSGGASSSSNAGADLSQCDDVQSNEDGGSESDFLTSSGLVASLPASITATPTQQSIDNHIPNPLTTGNFHLDQMEIQHELEKALGSYEATMTETPGMVKMEPDEHHQHLMQQHHEKPYTISATNMIGNNCGPGSPFPQEGYQRRQRRSEAELKKAAEMVASGHTFQVASEKYSIPISTIRFYMARKGILQRRKRGRGACHGGVNSQPSSPASPPFPLATGYHRNYESLNSSLQ